MIRLFYKLLEYLFSFFGVLLFKSLYLINKIESYFYNKAEFYKYQKWIEEDNIYNKG